MIIILIITILITTEPIIPIQTIIIHLITIKFKQITWILTNKLLLMILIPLLLHIIMIIIHNKIINLKILIQIIKVTVIMEQDTIENNLIILIPLKHKNNKDKIIIKHLETDFI